MMPLPAGITFAIEAARIAPSSCARRCVGALAALALLIAPAAAQEIVHWPIVEVYDGDTVYAEIPTLPAPLRRVGLRLAGIDAPERGRRARCAEEAALAERARASLARMLAGGAVAIKPIGWDKYGGRVDVEIYAGGVSVGDRLVGAGLARRYDGKGRRAGWCA
jgi:endonuclease YncB( thermonuclease family)